MKIEGIQDIFFQECDEGLIQAEAGLLALQSGAYDDETINTIFRAVHSIKGGSGALGFTALQHFTHHFESLLDQIRNGDHAITSDLVATLLGAFDTLADHVAAIRGEKPEPDDAAMLASLKMISTAENGSATAIAETVGAVAVAVADPAPAHDLDFDLSAMIDALGSDLCPLDGDGEQADDCDAGGTLGLYVRPLNGAIANGGEPLFLLRELADLGASLCATDLSHIPDIEDFDPRASYLGWHLDLPSSTAREQVEEIFDFVEEDCILHFSTDDSFPTPPVPALARPVGSPARRRCVTLSLDHLP